MSNGFTILRVKPTVLRVKQKYYYILKNCFTRKIVGFTRKTIVGANRVRIHLLRVKQTRKTKILLYFNVLFTRKVNCFTRKGKCFTRKTLDK